MLVAKAYIRRRSARLVTPDEFTPRYGFKAKKKFTKNVSPQSVDSKQFSARVYQFFFNEIRVGRIRAIGCRRGVDVPARWYSACDLRDTYKSVQ